MLQGRDLTVVQAIAVEVLLMRERRVQGEEFANRMKFALLTHDPSNYRELFAPTMPRESVSPDEDLSNTEGEWVFDPTSISRDEVESILSGAISEIDLSVDADDMRGVPGRWPS